jgi:amidohydrolase
MSIRSPDDPQSAKNLGLLDTIPEEEPEPLAAPLSPGEVAQLLLWRRALHQAPELSMREVNTCAYVRDVLIGMGFSRVHTLGGTGLVVTLGRGEVGRTLLLRADMDALPIHEQTGLDFASQTPGCMHACGHDAHVAILLAVARRLRMHEDAIAGTVVLCFQPGEENGRGALAMIEDGLLDGRYARELQPEHAYKVDHAIGLHVWSPLPTGTISATPGPVMAAVDEFSITVRGKGGHGAVPHTATDAIVAAAAVVQALQTVVSRRIDPLDPAVVTVGSIHGGSAFNVIVEEVVLTGTARSFSQSMAGHLPRLIEETARGAAAVNGATATTVYQRYTIAVRNDPVIAHLVAISAQATPGVQHVDHGMRLMAGEDFAYILDRVPGCFFFVGCGKADGTSEPHHSPRFLVDESALPIGAAVMLTSVASYFSVDDVEPRRPGAIL